MLNALSFDIEEHFQVAAFADNVSRDNWDSMPSRVEKNTQKLIEMLDESGIKATFFILGWVADRYPQLVREIQECGHEIASHGYSHQLIYKQSEAVFKEETLRSKALLEDIVQQPVLGYRAASYSITAESLWALDILIEAGFQYDSSIFPIHHDRYGIVSAPRTPHVIEREHGSIVELPLTTTKLLGMTLPAAGGGYFRLYPYKLSQKLFAMARAQIQSPQMFYLHPWEIDAAQPKIEAGWLSTFRHYNNLDRCEARLKCLFEDFSFDSITSLLSQDCYGERDKLPVVRY